MNRAIFFDRDGVLNEEVGYLFEREKYRRVGGAAEAVKFFNDRNYLVIVVTNQSGIARGFYTEDDVKNLHNFMREDFKKSGAKIDAFYYCPHHPEGTIERYKKICNCRKPEPGMILRACKDFEINPAQSFLIGDSERDIESGKRAGLQKNFLFPGGNLYEFVKKNFEPNFE